MPALYLWLAFHLDTVSTSLVSVELALLLMLIVAKIFGEEVMYMVWLTLAISSGVVLAKTVKLYTNL